MKRLEQRYLGVYVPGPGFSFAVFTSPSRFLHRGALEKRPPRAKASWPWPSTGVNIVAEAVGAGLLKFSNVRLSLRAKDGTLLLPSVSGDW